MWFLASEGVHSIPNTQAKGKYTTVMYHLSNLELSKNGAADVQISIKYIGKIALGSHVISNLESLTFSFLLTLVKLLKIYPKENTMKKKARYKDILTGTLFIIA